MAAKVTRGYVRRGMVRPAVVHGVVEVMREEAHVHVRSEIDRFA